MKRIQPKFGKKEHVWDDRTVKLGKFLRDEIRPPTTYDFDKHRAVIPLNDWGSRSFRCDVLAAQAEHVVRWGRLKERRTIPLSEHDVVRRYKRMTGCKQPGDEHDTGLTVLDAMKEWRREGYLSDNFKIYAYGELDPDDLVQMRRACYVLCGIFIGLWLPVSVLGMLRWDYNRQTGEDWKPGGLGGFLGYCKAYDENGYEVLGWGQRIRVTNRFVAKYCDEAWGVIGTLDKQVADVTTFAEK
jgi:hypothetical protein